MVADGTLATTSLLFLYEISASMNVGSGFWQKHLLGAKEIIRKRAEKSIEAGDGWFISWLMATWDSMAALTGGNCALVEFLIAEDLLPPAGVGRLLPNIKKNELEQMEHTLIVGPIYQFLQPVILMLAEAGKIMAYSYRGSSNAAVTPASAKMLAFSEIASEGDPNTRVPSLAEVEERVRYLEDTLSVHWDRSRPPLLDHLITFDDVEEIFQKKWTKAVPVGQNAIGTYFGLRIYLYRIVTDYKVRHGIVTHSSSSDEHIEAAVRNILLILDDIIKFDMLEERRFILMPLFMAALETRAEVTQALILTTLAQLDKLPWGMNFPRTKEFLEALFKAQGSGDKWHRIDWYALMMKRGPFILL